MVTPTMLHCHVIWKRILGYESSTQKENKNCRDEDIKVNIWAYKNEQDKKWEGKLPRMYFK